MGNASTRGASLCNRPLDETGAPLDETGVFPLKDRAVKAYVTDDNQFIIVKVYGDAFSFKFEYPVASWAKPPTTEEINVILVQYMQSKYHLTLRDPGCFMRFLIDLQNEAIMSAWETHEWCLATYLFNHEGFVFSNSALESVVTDQQSGWAGRVALHLCDHAEEVFGPIENWDFTDVKPDQLSEKMRTFFDPHLPDAGDSGDAGDGAAGNGKRRRRL